ncbi:MAG: hypothetical protein F6J93_15205 [Oscillatoria sp. SIO1A7]|nr:hypothetical protein [Oscillatoria sp. SIO1A7]
MKTEGAGKAYQAVAQSMALAVQDGTDYLRNIEALAIAAQSVLTEQLVKNTIEKKMEEAGDCVKSMSAITASLVTPAVGTFGAIGDTAGEVLKKFPSGE